MKHEDEDKYSPVFVFQIKFKKQCKGNDRGRHLLG